MLNGIPLLKPMVFYMLPSVSYTPAGVKIRSFSAVLFPRLFAKGVVLQRNSSEFTQDNFFKSRNV